MFNWAYEKTYDLTLAKYQQAAAKRYIYEKRFLLIVGNVDYSVNDEKYNQLMNKEQDLYKKLRNVAHKFFNID